MSELAEAIFGIRRRLRALELRQMQRELDDLVRRVKRLEAARPNVQRSEPNAPDTR